MHLRDLARAGHRESRSSDRARMALYNKLLAVAVEMPRSSAASVTVRHRK
jgi:hypothetical protein